MFSGFFDKDRFQLLHLVGEFGGDVLRLAEVLAQVVEFENLVVERIRIGGAEGFPRRAVHFGARVLILDEPTAGLDLGGREDLLKRFSEFASDPSAPASILVTHHIEEIPTGTTHALILKDGAVAVSGPIHDVITSEHMSAVFELPMEVRHEGSRFFARAL